MPRFAFVTLSLALAASLSGCFGFGHCGPFYSDATWHEPGLYEALANKTGAILLPKGFEFEHAEVVSRWGEETRVRHVSWANESGRRAHDGMHETRISLTWGEAVRGASAEGPHISMMADARVANETWRALLDGFLNATEARTNDRADWIDAFLADRTVAGYSYGADGVERPILSAARSIDQDPDLEGLARALGNATSSLAGVGHATMSWKADNGTWHYHLAIPSRPVEIGELQGEPVTLKVDSADQVEATMPQEMGEHPDDYKGWVAAWFQENGLPPPTFTGFEAHAAIC